MAIRNVVLIALGVCVLGGCGTVYRLDDRSDVGLPRSIHLVDGRSAETKRLVYEPSLPGNRFGDDNFEPDRVKLLAANIDAQLGDRFKGKRIVLKSYDVFSYAPSAIATSRALGTSGALLVLGFSPVVITGVRPQRDYFLTRIVIELDGERFAGEASENFTGLVDLSDARRANRVSVQKATDQLIDSIQKRYP